MAIKVLTWNLFHARDGHPAARANRSSLLTGRPVAGGGHLHLNRKLTAPIAAVIAALDADIVALQEVPTAAVGPLVRASGMDAIAVTTGPLIGPRRLRDRLAQANPDLWASHEGNANLLLVAPRLGTWERPPVRRILNPPAVMVRTLRGIRPPLGEAWRWATERRGLAAGRLRLSDGRLLAVGCLHLHNGWMSAMAHAEAVRALAALRALRAPDGAILAGDLNARPDHPAHAALVAGGLVDHGPANGIDRILTRSLICERPPAALPDRARTVRVPHRGRWWPVLLSDHAPVIGVYRLGANPDRTAATPQR